MHAALLMEGGGRVDKDEVMGAVSFEKAHF